MNASRVLRRLLLALSLALLASGASAQGASQYKPEVGQQGKDVVWVPTPDILVERMLDMAKVTAQDFVLDLGSGDGRTVIHAARRGATAMGIEYNPDMVELSKRNAREAGVGGKATFVKADLFETDLSRATVITMFLLPDINLKLRPRILDLKPGTRVVSNSFTMAEWNPDQTERVSGECTTWCTAHLWIVPAKVEGTWQVKDGELRLKQDFQMVSGTLNAGGRETPVKGQLAGDQLSFTAGNAYYSGRVNGNSITDGTVTSNNSNGTWGATRK